MSNLQLHVLSKRRVMDNCMNLTAQM